MPQLPSMHAGAALLITIVVFVLFAQGRVKVELICLGLIAVLALGLYAFPLANAGPYTGMEVAFGGFGHEALVAIVCLMILGRGLVVTGALEPAARVMARLWRFSKALGMLCTLLVCMILSAFVNDTPILILMLPVLLDLVDRAGVPASKTLMPVNSAILIGGTASAIGTSTNILVMSIARDLGVPPIGVFAFSDIVAVAAFVAFPYLWLIMPRLLPTSQTRVAQAPRLYHAALHVTDAGFAGGKPLDRLLKRIGGGIQVTELVRDGRPLGTGDPKVLIQPGDQVHVSGTMTTLHEASEVLRAPLAEPHLLEAIREEASRRRKDPQLAELVVGPDSPLIGESARSTHIADRFGVVVLGAYRSDVMLQTSAPHPRPDRLQVGDLLLVSGTVETLSELEQSQRVMLLGTARDLPRSAKAPLAIAIVASVVVLAAFKILPIAIAALAGTIAMLVTRCVLFERVGRALSAEVIVLVAAAIALGRALVETGAADWLGSVFALGLGAHHPAAVLVALMAFTTLMTNFVSNAAAAAVGTPLAVSLAAKLSLPAEPMVLAVLFGANLCYVTPMAYQTNLLIMRPGGYRFHDYVRAGLPLALLMITSLALLLMRRYGL
ncbi:MAG: SLC13 family permease [bacterium]